MAENEYVPLQYNKYYGTYYSNYLKIYYSKDLEWGSRKGHSYSPAVLDQS